ncbi:hypothetical protein QN360_15370, partial [Glaciimonas sp. CA11.2]|uniref:hypothetical protein n=1 Tax=Glaciimonas sp. CA11.2 TaxID=3048601 RepID=UPI002B2389BE
MVVKMVVPTLGSFDRNVGTVAFREVRGAVNAATLGSLVLSFYDEVSTITDAAVVNFPRAIQQCDAGPHLY